MLNSEVIVVFFTNMNALCADHIHYSRNGLLGMFTYHFLLAINFDIYLAWLCMIMCYIYETTAITPSIKYYVRLTFRQLFSGERKKKNLLSLLNVEGFQLDKTETNFRIDFIYQLESEWISDSFALRLDRHDIRLNKQQSF